MISSSQHPSQRLSFSSDSSSYDPCHCKVGTCCLLQVVTSSFASAPAPAPSSRHAPCQRTSALVPFPAPPLSLSLSLSPQEKTEHPRLSSYSPPAHILPQPLPPGGTTGSQNMTSPLILTSYLAASPPSNSPRRPSPLPLNPRRSWRRRQLQPQNPPNPPGP